MSRHLSATGRMGHHDMKASQLNGAEVKSSSGDTLGTVSDVIVNPGSGRMDFAILSLSSSSSSSGGATSPSGSSSGSSTSPGGSSSSSDQSSASSSSSSSSGKQVAVPWMLLRPSSMGAGSAASSTSGQQPSFTFIGDPSKLQSAPAFDQNTDVSQTSWRQGVYAYFGLTQPGSSTGGAESPGGSSSGSQQQQSPGSSGQQ